MSTEKNSKPMKLSDWFTLAAIGSGIGAAAVGGASLLLGPVLPGIAMMLLGASAASAVLGWLSTSIFTVDQKTEALITSFGKHTRSEKNPGLHLMAPWPFNIVATTVSTDLLQVQENLATKTKDDLFVSLPIAIQFEVADTAKYYFDNRNAIENMKKSVSQAVRTSTSGKDFQELYSDRDEVSTAVIDHVSEQVKEFGINIRRIIIDEPTAPQEVQNAFNEVRASERLKEAARNKAEAYKIEIVAKAEGDKTADVLRGEGKAGYRRAIFDQYSEQISKLEASGVPRHEAIDVMMRAMEQDTLRDVGEHGNTVVFNSGASNTAPGPAAIAEIHALRALSGTKTPEQNNTRPAPPPAAAAPG
jgi:regulator of protease activity HflC (stomatin/prohibitin superfamily)